MSRKYAILDRYPRTEDGRIIIDIAAVRIEDLFDNFDKATPYAKKDLDTDFYTYLVDSIREIGKEPFVIQITLEVRPEPARWHSATEGIRNFFIYTRQLKMREMGMLFRTSFILLGIGAAVMMLSIWVHRTFSAEYNVFRFMFAEGLTVAAWVLLWESLASFLIEWPPFRRQIRWYKRIAGAPITYQAHTQEPSEDTNNPK